MRPDAIIATGRSDYPDQVNNVLCFPYLFRGALDVGATSINEEMKSAAVLAIADLAHAEMSDVVAAAYRGQRLEFGPDYLIPTPFDPRLIERVARPLPKRLWIAASPPDRSPQIWKSIANAWRALCINPAPACRAGIRCGKNRAKRVAFAEGEDDRVLRAAQVIVDEGLARPVLVGRDDVIGSRLQSLSLRIQPGSDCDIVSFENDASYEDTWREYYNLVRRSGVTAGARPRSYAHTPHADRRDAAASWRCRCHAVRHFRRLLRPSQLCAPGYRPAPGCVCTLGTMNMLDSRWTAVRLRHLCQSRSIAETARRINLACG